MGVRRVQVISTGYIGSPGYTNFYFDTVVGPSVADQVDAVRDFWIALLPEMSNTQTARIAPEVPVFDEVTGALETNEVATAGQQAPMLGTNVGGQTPGGIGVCIAWTTASVNRGRRVRGRTFIVPMTSNSFEANGTPGATAIGVVQTAAADLVAGGTGFGIWSRPRAGAGGLFAESPVPVVRDRAAFLSSRRA